MSNTPPPFLNRSITTTINSLIALSLTLSGLNLFSSDLQAATPVKKNPTKVVAKPSDPKVKTPITATKTLEIFTKTVQSDYQVSPISLKLDILRAIPLEVKSYHKVPERFSSSGQVVSTLDGSRNLLVHMESIRKTYSELSSTEQGQLLQKLHVRSKDIPDDAVRYFDYGYAQMVLRNNKTGLFFLRKANDQIKDQFSNLAYAMAQAEADINLENSTPEAMTTRKLDVIFRFKDAVTKDANAHKPGFWPSAVRVLDVLKPMNAYSSITESDISVAYVPFGNTTITELPGKGDPSFFAGQFGGQFGNKAKTSQKAEATTFLGVASGESACSTKNYAFTKTAEWLPYHTRTIDFTGQNRAVTVNAYKNTKIEDNYQIVALDNQKRAMANFTAPMAPYIVEDIDADGVFEFVIRQYKYNRLQPIIVYRLGDCGFEPDTDVEAYFN